MELKGYIRVAVSNVRYHGIILDGIESIFPRGSNHIGSPAFSFSPPPWVLTEAVIILDPFDKIILDGIERKQILKCDKEKLRSLDNP